MYEKSTTIEVWRGLRMLSNEQQQIVKHIYGPVLVISCPGSGKTTVIVNRTNQMIQNGIEPGKILVVTFTKESATEMETRFLRDFGIKGVNFGTIHSFCFKVLASYYSYRKEDILTGTEQYIFFANCLREMCGKVEEDKVLGLMSHVSFCRNKECPPGGYDPCDPVITKQEFLEAYKKYEAWKREVKKIDFDDMLILTRELLKSELQVLEYWQNKFPYIMVDEYQDTSSIQSDICNLLAAKFKNICVVGDDDQSIYRFRGAKVETILNFRKDYPDATIYKLGINYRSTTEIVNRAGLLIKNNTKRYKKDFLANRTEKGYVGVKVYDMSVKQTLSVVKQIEELHENGVPYNEIAVLYRTNIQNQLFLPHMMSKKVPFYTTEAPQDIHDEIMFGDIKAYYALANGVGTNKDLLRILNRPMRYLKKELFKDVAPTKSALEIACRKAGERAGDCYMEIIKLLRDLERMKELKPSEFCSYMDIYFSYTKSIIDYAEYIGKDKEHIITIWEMLKKEAENFSTMGEWLAYGSEYKKKLQDERKKNYKKGVCFSTFHASKGLEWQVVFIIDATDDYCPHKKAESNDDFEEERRLFYVGVTRAKTECRISYVKDDKTRASRYLGEMGLQIGDS